MGRSLVCFEDQVLFCQEFHVFSFENLRPSYSRTLKVTANVPVDPTRRRDRHPTCEVTASSLSISPG
jgi:hypothetical protein